METLGIEINPYDPCVANKIVEGNQMTVCWYVDDLKISQKDELVVSALVIEIIEIFGGLQSQRVRCIRILGWN